MILVNNDTDKQEQQLCNTKGRQKWNRNVVKKQRNIMSSMHKDEFLHAFRWLTVPCCRSSIWKAFFHYCCCR